MSLPFLRLEYWLAFAGLTLALILLAWRLRLRWLPAWILRVALVALVLIGVFAPRKDLAAGELPSREVMVLDQSDSLSVETRQQAWQQAAQWQAGGESRLLVAFGSETQPVLPPAVSEAVRLQPRLDGRASDLPAALRLALNLLTGAPGRIVLLTDGLASQPGQVDALLAEVVQAGHTLDAAPLAARPADNDVAVGNLIAPTNLWAGTDFDLLAPVLGSASGGTTPLQLAINGRPTTIPAEFSGGSAYRFHIPDLPEGIVTLQVTAGDPAAAVPAEGATPPAPAGGDPFPANNTAYTTLQVFPAPRVLFVTAAPGAEGVTRFLGLLTDNGIQVETVAPNQLPTNLNQLGSFRVIFLHNLLSSQLNQEQMVALQVFVSRLAGGVVFIGGQNSYTLGGYPGTLLEPMLPVKLEPPPRSERPPLLFTLVLDRSASMNTGLLRGVQPIALAREAAMRSIETLREQDYLGVLTFSDSSIWAFPLQPLGGAAGFRQALDAVSQVQAVGGTHMFQALQDALVGIVSLPEGAPTNRHILLLSDGQSTDGDPESFRALAEAAQSQGITISTIALGPESDTPLMEAIATAAKGRFYAVEDANDLPRILISESQAARSENVQAGETSLRVGDLGHPVLSGLSDTQLPTLNSYNALQSKVEEGAEDVLVSTSFGDPILSTWQYGLGRVAAWMTNLGEQWTGAWPEADAEGQFWSQVVRYALVNPALGPAQVNIQVEPTRVLVDAALFTANGGPLNLTEVVFTYAESNGQAHSFPLVQRSASVYQVEIPRPLDGAYRAIITFAGEDGASVEVPAPFAVNPPDEWLPHNPAAGQANLDRWTAAGGGQVTALETLLAPAAAGPQDEAFDSGDWLKWLLLAAVLFWPLEIAIRRRWLPWV